MLPIAIRCCPMIGQSSASPHSASQFMHHRTVEFIYKGNLSAEQRSDERRGFSMQRFSIRVTEQCRGYTSPLPAPARVVSDDTYGSIGMRRQVCSAVFIG